ncbi:NAD(P)-binding oxidoreductase [Pediococcus cellicola]|uniref:NAD(P)-binding domain-containing protein n=1 Tax=Pediococcus cellicola TaxID=319652 RepID=A0A0R2IMF8_9LACO|nr:NAD(P)-binding oxidoreductase [Pediococcus cellicola]KRN66175.1 hypothetical protein IV80_GL001420 [Pediococcus cellicola]GEL15263.1 hypothetical protein PCE01_10650 [Pediococcus cellicola]
MKRVLVMGVNSPIGRAFWKLCQQKLDSQYQFTFIETKEAVPEGFEKVQPINLTDAESLAPIISENDVLVINVAGWDVDYILDAVMDAIEGHGIRLEKIVFCSVAGVNNEFPSEKITAVSHDFGEFIKQQQYAGKLVDESEIPYTILRPSVIDQNTTTNYQLFDEGQSMQQAKAIRPVAVAQVIYQALSEKQFKNQSIGIGG